MRRRTTHRWTYRVPLGEATDCLRRAFGSVAFDVCVLDHQGRRLLQVAGGAARADGAPAADTVVSGDVEIDGTLVWRLDARGPSERRATLAERMDIAVCWLANLWRVNENLDNLAGEVLRAYEELHLLYELSEHLTGKLTMSAAIELIEQKTMSALSASGARITLGTGGSDEVAEAMTDGEQLVTHSSDRRLETMLRSGGDVMGRLVLTREAHEDAFAARDSKLLAAVGTLAGSAIRNAQLFDELRQREAHLRAVLDNVADAILVVDEMGVLCSVNSAGERIFGYTSAELLGQPLGVLFASPTTGSHDPSSAAWLRTTTNDPINEVNGLRRDGGVVPLEVALSDMQVEGQRLVIVSARDISERKRAEAALMHQALHDALTNLPNRRLLRDRLEQALRAARRGQTSLGLIVMDLDGFKEINDTFGHHHGDALLQQIGQRLSHELRGSDTIARLGGDEFAALLPTANEESGTRIAERLLHSLEEPFVLGEHTLHIGASAGLAVGPQHGMDSDTLLRHADVAMYVAKRAGGGLSIYDARQDLHTEARLRLSGEMRNAIEEDRMVLHYQPKMSFADTSVFGVEALIRWDHPVHGLLSPDRFIPLAEQSGLIKPLSEWVLNAAIRQCRVWRDKGIDLVVSANLAMRNLLDPHLPETLQKLLMLWDVPPASLVIEVTESGLMSDPSRTREILTRIHELGVGISIDDFGTGYSSLAYLKQFPVDELKIDKSFIKEMTVNPQDAAIVRSTIQLGHDLQLTVVAEGVEDTASWNALAALGCDLMQGYYLSRPLAASDFERWLQSLPTTFHALPLAS